MLIQIIATSVETKPTAKGSYQVLEVTYKNLSFQGKTETQKVFSFTPGTAFKDLANATGGSKWEVVKIKNDKGYNEWSAAKPSDGSTEQTPTTSARGATSASVRSSYETPEERAQRQVYIIRQSSISAAVSTLSVGAKAVKPADVIDLAEEYTDFVLNGKLKLNNPGPSGFDDLPDFDIPSVE